MLRTKVPLNDSYMNAVQTGLSLSIGLIAAGFFLSWWRAARLAQVRQRMRPSFAQIAVGGITDFFDTLGIGSFATTTALFRLFRMVPDELIPGTLNVGHAATSIAQALIFIVAVQVEPILLVCMILAAVAGSWVGAGIVIKLNREGLQVAMGAALLVAAIFFSLVNLGMLPGGGDAQRLSMERFTVAVSANFLFGALMPLGIGLFAPCMITLALLGMSPIVAFPVMMGSCAFCQPAASLRFLKSNRYSLGAALGLTLGGVPAVLVAAFVVKSLPLIAMRWLVVIVVAYVSACLLYSGLLKVPSGVALRRNA